jgi:predicted Zn-dependent peptidase
MTRLLSLLLAVCAVPALAAEKKPLPAELPPFGEDKPLPVPRIAESKLTNGLTVWLVPREGFPRLTAVLAVRGGTAADPKGAEGIAELLADTVREGTKARTSRAIAEELQAVGADLGSFAGADAIYLNVSGLSSGAPKMIEVLADVARHAAFPAEEVELAKGNALQGLMARESTPEFLAQKALARAVYGEHPYRVVAPSKEALQAATPAQLAQEHARRFRPDRALLVVVGAFDVGAANAAIQKHFGAWAAAAGAASTAETPASPAAGARRLLLVSRPGSVQSLLLTGRPVATVTDPAYYPLLVANTIVAGSFGSRLVENIREDKGYTYSPGGGVSTRAKGGLLTMRADVRSDVTAAALTEMFYEQDRLASTTPTEEELSRAKRYQAGLYLLRNQIQGAVAQTLASNWVNGLPPGALGEFVTQVNAVTAAQVREAGRAFYPSSRQTVVVVGDAAKVKEELAPFGEVTEATP